MHFCLLCRKLLQLSEKVKSILNTIISDIILDKGAGIMQSIEIKNASESIIKKIDLMKEGRLLKREDLIE